MIRTALIALAFFAASCNAPEPVVCDCAPAVAAAVAEVSLACNPALAEDDATVEVVEAVVPEASVETGPVRPTIDVAPSAIGGGITTFTSEMFSKPINYIEYENGTSVSIGSIGWTKKTWIADRRDGYYTSIAAEKGESIVTFDFTVASEEKDVRLPQFYLVAAKPDGSIQGLGIAYSFFRWTSHAAFYGTAHDRLNDFAYADSVKYSAGLVVSDQILDWPVFIVAYKTPCTKLLAHPAQGRRDFHDVFQCPDFTPINGDKFFKWYTLVAARNMKKAFASK